MATQALLFIVRRVGTSVFVCRVTCQATEPAARSITAARHQARRLQPHRVHLRRDIDAESVTPPPKLHLVRRGQLSRMDNGRIDERARGRSDVIAARAVAALAVDSPAGCVGRMTLKSRQIRLMADYAVPARVLVEPPTQEVFKSRGWLRSLAPLQSPRFANARAATSIAARSCGRSWIALRASASAVCQSDRT